jgi:hypothetical protein
VLDIFIVEQGTGVGKIVAIVKINKFMTIIINLSMVLFLYIEVLNFYKNFKFFIE